MTETLKLSSKNVAAYIQKGELELAQKRVSIQEASKIFGTDFFGPAAIFKAFGVQLDKRDIPDISFSAEELRIARALRQMLILRIDNFRIQNDVDIRVTMKNIMHHIWGSGSMGTQFIFPQDRLRTFENEPFFMAETPRTGWALVTKDVLEETLGKDYDTQTEILTDYFHTKTLPQGSDKNLNISLRRTAVEASYDSILYFLNKGQHLLEDTSDWTMTDVFMSFVSVGPFNSRGLDLDTDLTAIPRNNLGVCFSRTV